MRVFAASAALVLLLEFILVLAFLAGFCWIGGWLAGALLCAGVLVLLVMPWIGDLTVHYDSAKARLHVRASWWASVTRETGPGGELCVRILGIPWRRPLREREPTKERDVKREARRAHGRAMITCLRENLGDSIRAALAGLHAGHELLTRSKELRIRISAPTQISYADLAIAGAVGERRLGPLALLCTAAGERRVTVRYRIGLLRAGLTGLMMAVDAKPWRLARSMRAAGEAAEEADESAEPKGAQ